jgi:phage terminase large subunit-like protein
LNRDYTAVVACAFDSNTKQVRLAWHRVFQPSVKDPLDFEATVERALMDLRTRFNLKQVFYDPYQLVSVAQRLTKAGLPMEAFPQTTGNLTEASSNLYELIKGHNLVAYPDYAMRLAVSRAVAIESTRGWRIAKEKASHKIDIEVEGGSRPNLSFV